MKFGSMSPAERMKASGLVGLIIIVLFFAVHTVLGAVAPKKNDTPPTGAAPAGVPGPPPPVGGPPAAAASVPVSGKDAFPMDKATASAKLTSAALDRSVPDPFIQINEPDGKGPRNTGSAPKFRESKPEIQPLPGSEAPSGPLPGFRSSPLLGGSLPGANGGGPGPAPAALNIAPIEPEIKVVGIVHDPESPVATLSVGGVIQIARPGDPLAKGYRLSRITEDGVVIRHKLDYTTLRVGAAMNSPAGK